MLNDEGDDDGGGGRGRSERRNKLSKNNKVQFKLYPLTK